MFAHSYVWYILCISVVLLHNNSFHSDLSIFCMVQTLVSIVYTLYCCLLKIKILLSTSIKHCAERKSISPTSPTNDKKPNPNIKGSRSFLYDIIFIQPSESNLVENQRCAFLSRSAKPYSNHNLYPHSVSDIKNKCFIINVF